MTAGVSDKAEGDLVLKANVLVVDDESAYAKAMEDALLSYGLEVRVAHGAKEALQSMQEITPDLILLDIMMPEVDGLMLLRLLRTDANRPRIPVIVISAKVSEEAKADAVLAGADRFLEKPFTSSQLEVTLSEYVALS